jgi:hypothetical protein
MAGNSAALPLDEYQDLSHAVAVVTELVVLDDAWTREATASSDPATRDDGRVEQLSGVVDRLDQLYGEIGALGPRLAEIFRAREDLLRERYQALVADEAAERPQPARSRSLTADERSRLRAFVDERGQGDVVALATDAAYQLEQQSGNQGRNVREEYDRIRGGASSDGDMDPDFEFWVQAVSLAATIALGPEAGGVVELIGGIISWLVG